MIEDKYMIISYAYTIAFLVESDYTLEHIVAYICILIVNISSL